MMTVKKYNIKLEDLLYFIIKNYPNRNHLSKARLTKIVFLMDWKSSLDFGDQITNIKWYFDTYRPYVSDVVNLAIERKDLFKINNFINYFNNSGSVIDISNKNYEVTIPEYVKNIYNFILDETKKMSFNDFIDFVYSTYPIQVSTRYSYLDLVNLAKEYKNN